MDTESVWELLSLLERDYEDERRGLYLRKVAEGYQLCTKEQHYELLMNGPQINVVAVVCLIFFGVGQVCYFV